MDQHLESHFPIWKCLALSLPGGSVSNRTLKTLETAPARYYESELPKLGKAIYKSMSTGTFVRPIEFSSKKDSLLPKILVELFSKVYDREGNLREMRPSNIRTVHKLLQLTMAFYKVERTAQKCAENALVGEFLDLQKSLFRYKDAVAEDFAFLRRCRKRLCRVLKKFNPCEIIPRHGPGAVFEQLKPWEKWSKFMEYPEIAELFPSDQYQFLSPTHICDEGIGGILRKTPPLTRLCVVPKNADTGRLIAIEERYPQFLKLGVMDQLYRIIPSSIAGGHVNFTDQTINHTLARLGSESGYYATLDLKAASDSVSKDLVSLLFPRTFLKYTSPLRATHTVWNGERHELSTYATMGSALCFPVEALVFWTLAVEASGSQEIFVYGDDIICPSIHAEAITECFHNYGLIVNTNKSFSQGPFRESCGEDFILGETVSVSKWRLPPKDLCYLSTRIDQIVPFVNDIRRTWGQSVADTLLTHLLREFGPVPVTEKEFASAKAVVTSAHRSLNAAFLKRRWNKCLQRHEFRVPHVRTRLVRVEDSWYEIMRSILGSSSKKETGVYEDPNRVIHCWAWVEL